jgi:hypothetical protein
MCVGCTQHAMNGSHARPNKQLKLNGCNNHLYMYSTRINILQRAMSIHKRRTILRFQQGM